jgi:phage tail protein X
VATKMCMKCRMTNKAPGKQKCHECWMLEQPAHIQELDAARRRGAIPVEMHLAQVPKALWPAGRRWCSGCQSFRRLSDCTGSRCQVCNSLAAWEAMLPRTYLIGLPDGSTRPMTADDYWLMFREQGGRCYICGRESKSRRLAVDHNHITGLVRVLLCPDPEWGCNHAILGKIKDVPMAKRIVEVLEDPPAGRWITQ